MWCEGSVHGAIWQQTQYATSRPGHVAREIPAALFDAPHDDHRSVRQQSKVTQISIHVPRPFLSRLEGGIHGAVSIDPDDATLTHTVIPKKFPHSYRFTVRLDCHGIHVSAAIEIPDARTHGECELTRHIGLVTCPVG